MFSRPILWKLFNRQSFCLICFVFRFLSLMIWSSFPYRLTSLRIPFPCRIRKDPHLRFSPSFSLADSIINSWALTSSLLMNYWINSNQMLSCSNCILTAEKSRCDCVLTEHVELPCGQVNVTSLTGLRTPYGQALCVSDCNYPKICHCRWFLIGIQYTCLSN